MKLSKDIEDARKYLEQTEKTSDPYKKIMFFIDGIELIDLFYHENKDNNNSDLIKFATNLKITYTRSLIKQLQSFEKINMDYNDWVKYIALFMGIINTPVNRLINEEKDLNEIYVKFVNKKTIYNSSYKDILLSNLIYRLERRKANNKNYEKLEIIINKINSIL